MMTVYTYKIIVQSWYDLQWASGAIFEHEVEQAQRQGWEVINTKIHGDGKTNLNINVTFLLRKEIIK
jgi:hypothetical protein